MFKIEIKKENEENQTYEVYYTNEYQEIHSFSRDLRPYYGEWQSVPNGLTVTDITYKSDDSYTYLCKNSFFPIAVKKHLEYTIYTDCVSIERGAYRQIVPLSEDEYWALYEKYYENTKEEEEIRKEIFKDFYTETVNDSIAAEMAADAHAKRKMYKGEI